MIGQLQWLQPLATVILCAHLKLSTTLPVPDEERDTSTKLLGSSVVTSVSIVMDQKNNYESAAISFDNRKRVVPIKEILISPAGLLRPDNFLFYTFNSRGDVITKQMTEEEIQSLIATGGGLPPTEKHESQKTEYIFTKGTKVADVVQSVQNVLKAELNRSAVSVGTISTIPDHASAEWSNILPAILAGDVDTGSPINPKPQEVEAVTIIEPENRITSTEMSYSLEILDSFTMPETESVTVNTYTANQLCMNKVKCRPNEVTPSVTISRNSTVSIVSLEEIVHVQQINGTISSSIVKVTPDDIQVQDHSGKTAKPEVEERPMIQVPIITVDENMESTKPPGEMVERPVFQIVNTLSIEKVGTKNNLKLNGSEYTSTMELNNSSVVDSKPETLNFFINRNDDTSTSKVLESISDQLISTNITTLATTQTEFDSNYESVVDVSAGLPMLDVSPSDTETSNTTRSNVYNTTSSVTVIVSDLLEAPIQTSKNESITKQEITSKEKNSVQENESSSSLSSSLLLSMYAKPIFKDSTPPYNVKASPDSAMSTVETIISQTEASEIKTAAPNYSNIDLVTENSNGMLKTNSLMQTTYSSIVSNETFEILTRLSNIPESFYPDLLNVSNGSENNDNLLFKTTLEPILSQAIIDVDNIKYQVLPQINPNEEIFETTTVHPETLALEGIIKKETLSKKPVWGHIIVNHINCYNVTSQTQSKTQFDITNVKTITDCYFVNELTNDNVTDNSQLLFTGSTPTNMEDFPKVSLETWTPVPTVLTLISTIPQVLKTTPLITYVSENSESSNLTSKKNTEKYTKFEATTRSVTVEMNNRSTVGYETEPNNMETSKQPGHVEEGTSIPNLDEVKSNASKMSETPNTNWSTYVSIITEIEPIASTLTTKIQRPFTELGTFNYTLSESEFQSTQFDAANKHEILNVETELTTEFESTLRTTLRHDIPSNDFYILAMKNESILQTPLTGPGMNNRRPETTDTLVMKIDEMKLIIPSNDVVTSTIGEDFEETIDQIHVKIDENESSVETDSIETSSVRRDVVNVGLDAIQYENLNVSSTSKASENLTKSPSDETQLIDVLSIISQPLENVPTQVSTPSIEVLTLPTNRYIVIDNIASSLIAGYATTTTRNTIVDNRHSNNTNAAATIKTKVNETASAYNVIINNLTESSNIILNVVNAKNTEEKIKPHQDKVDLKLVFDTDNTTIGEESEKNKEITIASQNESLVNNIFVDTIENRSDNKNNNTLVHGQAVTKVPFVKIDLSYVTRYNDIGTGRPDTDNSSQSINTTENVKVQSPDVSSNNHDQTYNLNSFSSLSKLSDMKVKNHNNETITSASSEILVSTSNLQEPISETNANNSVERIAELNPLQNNEIEDKTKITLSLNGINTNTTDVNNVKETDAMKTMSAFVESPKIQLKNVSSYSINNTLDKADKKPYYGVNKVPTEEEIVVKEKNRTKISTTNQIIDKLIADKTMESKNAYDKNSSWSTSPSSFTNIQPSQISLNAQPEVTIGNINRNESAEMNLQKAHEIDIIPMNDRTVLITKHPSISEAIRITVTQENTYDEVPNGVQTKISSNNNQDVLERNEIAQTSSETNRQNIYNSTNVSVISSIKEPTNNNHLLAGTSDTISMSSNKKEAPEYSQEKDFHLKNKGNNGIMNVSKNVGKEVIRDANTYMNLEDDMIDQSIIKTTNENNTDKMKVTEINTTIQTSMSSGKKENVNLNVSNNIYTKLEKKEETNGNIDNKNGNKDQSSLSIGNTVKSTQIPTISDWVSEKDLNTQEAKVCTKLEEKLEGAVNKNGNVKVENDALIKKINPIQPLVHVAFDEPIKTAEMPADHRVAETNNSLVKSNVIQKVSESKNPVNTDSKWTLIPHYTAQPSLSSSKYDRLVDTSNIDDKQERQNETLVTLESSQSASSLDNSIKNLDEDIILFSNLCNELAFSFWSAVNKGLANTSRSLTLSPFGITSILAMVFLGARGSTSDQMNDILKLDDVVTFNPHLVLQNVTDTVSLAKGQNLVNAAFVRELFVDKTKISKLMPFYKEQVQQFYDGFVGEINFAAISDIVRRRTNLLIRKQTGGRIKNFIKSNTMPLRPPLAAISANIFQMNCGSNAVSSDNRDNEFYFAISSAHVRQRRLIPITATVWRSEILAGYESTLDATAIALGGIEKLVSIIFVTPGQQGHTAPGDSLQRLEQRLIRERLNQSSWIKLLSVLVPRTGLELQIPKFSHRSLVNATAALKQMGLEKLFSKDANLKGISSIGNNLYLSDMLQINLFDTCGDETVSKGQHHVEVYPTSSVRNIQKSIEVDEVKRNLSNRSNLLKNNELNEQENMEKNRNRGHSTTLPIKPRLKLDRPFLYFVRHNPTGLILHMGRFNPRLT